MVGNCEKKERYGKGWNGKRGGAEELRVFKVDD